MALKNYPLKYLLLFLPFIAAVFIELFVLPIHQFTFRVWESLAVKRSFGILKGQFYPNMTVQKQEDGDLAYYTRCAIKKDVEWITDTYGYRKANSNVTYFPIVIVGDSNVAGSSLSQHELLSEVLERAVGQSTYPLASERLRALFQHDLLKKNPPRIVILESIERDIPEGFSPLKRGDIQKHSLTDSMGEALRTNTAIQRIAITLDRIFKGNMLNYLRARISGTGSSFRRVGSSNECSIFFLQGAGVNRLSPDERVERAAGRLKEYRDFLEKKNIRFIVLPIPNKETILYKSLHTERPDFLKRLTRRLKELNIEVVDTQKAFDDFYSKTGDLPYHRDDSHWNGLGVRIAADLLAEKIQAGPLGPADLNSFNKKRR
jgi:hypothetical protein